MVSAVLVDARNEWRSRPSSLLMRTLVLSLCFCVAVWAGGAYGRARALECAPGACELEGYALACTLALGLLAALVVLARASGVSIRGRTPRATGDVRRTRSPRAGARPRTALLWLVVAVVCCGLGRGWMTWSPTTAPAVSIPPSVADTELVEWVVRGASEPGARCRIVAEHADRLSVALAVPPGVCPLSAGQRLLVRARDLRSEGLHWRLPGSMHPHQLARARGVQGVFFVDHVWVRTPANRGYWAAVARLRSRAWDASRGSASRSLVVAVILGLGHSLAGEQRDALREAGLGHLLAVSGLHVGVTALVVRGVLLRVALLFAASPRLAVVLASAPVFAYVGLTGASPSAVRAAVMFGLLQLTVFAGRPGHGLTTLAVAAAALLALRPEWALSPGFQLSVAAMAVVVHPSTPQGLVAQSVHIVWVTAPLALVHFGSASLWGIVSNCLAIPVFTLWIVPLGFAGVAVLPWVGPVALEPAAMGAQLILDLAGALARIGTIIGPIDNTTLPLVAGVLLLVRFAVRGFVRRWLPPAFACVAVMLAVLLPWGERANAARFSWIAIGHERAAAVLAAQPGAMLAAPATNTTTSHGDLLTDAAPMSSVCLRDPALSPSRWLRLLPALGVRAVAAVESVESRARGAPPPHVVAVERSLARHGYLVATSRSLACTYPEDAQVRAAAARCRAQCHERVTATSRGETRQLAALSRFGASLLTAVDAHELSAVWTAAWSAVLTAMTSEDATERGDAYASWLDAQCPRGHRFAFRERPDGALACFFDGRWEPVHSDGAAELEGAP